MPTEGWIAIAVLILLFFIVESKTSMDNISWINIS